MKAFLSELVAIARALYCERGVPSGSKIAAIVTTGVALYYVVTTADPDFNGVALLLGVPWGIILGRKKVEPVVPASG